MALVCKKLATDAMLNEVMCVCSVCRPVKTCTEGLDYKGLSCSVMSAESSMNFIQEVPPFLFGDAPLKDSGCAFLIKLSLMDLVGFRPLHNAMCVIWVIREFLSS